MFDRRFAWLFSVIYAAAPAAALLAHSSTAFIVVVVIGGPVTGFMYWGSSPRRLRDQSRGS